MRNEFTEALSTLVDRILESDGAILDEFVSDAEIVRWVYENLR